LIVSSTAKPLENVTVLDSAQSVSPYAMLCETSHKQRRMLSMLARPMAYAVAFVAALALTPAVIAAQQAPAHAPAAAPASAQPAPAPGATQPAPVESHAAPAQSAPAPATPAADPHAPAAPATPAAGEGHAAPAAAEAHGAPQGAHGEAAGHGGEEHHGETPLAFASRIANFLILAGALYYFLRTPFANHLLSRGQQIRADLVTAKETSAAAAAQLAEIDKKLQALPGEIETLKARGKQEIAAEEARIKTAAENERHRLIEQTRRDVDLQVRLAKRELTEHAAGLAVSLATQQINQTITPDDQTRLVDRYVTQMRKAHD
jgi:F0F1-type ATP synthase membrane subunit b/b'